MSKSTRNTAFALAGLALADFVFLISFLVTSGGNASWFWSLLGASNRTAEALSICSAFVAFIGGVFIVIGACIYMGDWRIEVRRERSRLSTAAPGAPKPIAERIYAIKQLPDGVDANRRQVDGLCRDTAAYFAGAHTDEELKEYCKLLDMVKEQIGNRRKLATGTTKLKKSSQALCDQHDAAIKAYAEMIARMLAQRNAEKIDSLQRTANYLIDRNTMDKPWLPEGDD